MSLAVAGGWNWEIFKVPSKPNYFVILGFYEKALQVLRTYKGRKNIANKFLEQVGRN